MVQIHQINFRLKKSKRIGRGGKRGNYSGRGMKGQKARAGAKIRPALRDVILKFPKLRGVGNKKIERRIIEVNLEKVDKAFNEKEFVDLKSLQERKIIKIPKSWKTFKIKVLGKGSLTKPLIFSKELLFSKKALEEIKKSQSEIR
ncbi:MAG: uL15 family ribosomal protein [Candidatus Pacebacteria bacterium]|jgi:large subunit ribosomal protein L15|nr:uL15 family ribosomal protein [Candidatus Paceibacterota bacterium]